MVVKVITAWVSGSVSALGEALQSTADVLMSTLTLVVLRVSALPPDREHPYGHGKAELLSSAFQMLLILLTSVFIIWAAYRRLLSPESIRWDWAALGMGYAVISNLIVASRLTKRNREFESPSLAAESLHLRTDALMSGGVLVGLLLVGMTGIEAIDSGVAILFALVAMALAFRQLYTGLHPLMDGALPEDEIRRLETALDLHPEVRGFHNLRARMVGSRRFIELHVMLDDDLSFIAAHDLAEEIESELSQEFPGSQVSIHYEPHEAELEHRKKEHGE